MCNYHLNCTYLSHLSGSILFFPSFNVFPCFNSNAYAYKHVKQTPQSLNISKNTYKLYVEGRGQKEIKRESRFCFYSVRLQHSEMCVEYQNSFSYWCTLERSNRRLFSSTHFTRCSFLVALTFHIALSFSSSSQLMLFICREWNEWNLFDLSLLFEFCLRFHTSLPLHVSSSHSLFLLRWLLFVLSCVWNKPHNQFIITLCIEWMRIA